MEKYPPCKFSAAGHVSHDNCPHHSHCWWCGHGWGLCLLMMLSWHDAASQTDRWCSECSHRSLPQSHTPLQTSNQCRHTPPHIKCTWSCATAHTKLSVTPHCTYQIHNHTPPHTAHIKCTQSHSTAHIKSTQSCPAAHIKHTVIH